MNSELLIREFVAISQKNQMNQAQFPWGEGMNGQIEISVPYYKGLVDGELRARLRKTLSQIDHLSLGLDQNLGFDPYLPSICRFIHRDMGLPSEAKVTFYRGDGYSATFYGQP